MDSKKRKIIKQIKKIESFLHQRYQVEVDYSQSNDNGYYHDLKRIEINTRQNFRSRLHTLLHEAGHVVIRHVTTGSFKKEFPFMKRGGLNIRGDKNHRIDILREEVLAWEEGKKIANSLSIKLHASWWNRHRQEALKTYVEWI